MEPNQTYRPTHEAFARYFAGESTKEESDQIKNWAAQSGDNQTELETFRSVWQDVGTLKLVEPAVDSAAAFNKVKSLKNAREISSKSTFWNAWKVAALCVLAASLVFILLQEKNQPETIRFQAKQVDQVTLQDGSTIAINAGSEISYPETFKEEERVVQLKGEAFFEVTSNPMQPFKVKVGGVTVTVLGTSFNINETGEAVIVSVVTGTVEVKSTYGVEVLQPGDQVTASASSQQLVRTSTSVSGTEQFWASRKLSFEGSSLRTVISDLEEVYQVSINVSDQKILNCKLKATFEGQSIDEILEIISISNNLTVEQTNDSYLLTGEGCEP
ncbi:FecR family protein [Marinoscillum sp.]|uniref:FecR family protein n=1 Tax=Marinoscillum sp. TaxID=2024838 RepID=UPI003BAC083B